MSLRFGKPTTVWDSRKECHVHNTYVRGIFIDKIYRNDIIKSQATCLKLFIVMKGTHNDDTKLW